MIKSLGEVTATSGTPERLTKNQSDPTARYAVHGFQVEALDDNVGKVYIGDREGMLTVSPRTGLIKVLPAPATGVIPSWSVTKTAQPAGFNMANYWVDVENTGEGVLVTALVA